MNYLNFYLIRNPLSPLTLVEPSRFDLQRDPHASGGGVSSEEILLNEKMIASCLKFLYHHFSFLPIDV